VYEHINFGRRPFVAIWETTQACDLACAHCRACAQPLRHSFELTTDEAKRLIDEIAAMEVPVFVLTGGDPLRRPDIFELVQYAVDRNVRISLTPSATPLLTRESIVRLKECGVARLAVSLDGPTAAIHDAFRRVPGSYQWTIDAVRWAREIGLPVQINTTITRHNLAMLDDIIALLETLDITLWSVFFWVPTGRGSDIDFISAEEFEHFFQKLHQTSQRAIFDIKTTEPSTIGAICCSAGQRPVAWENVRANPTIAFRSFWSHRWIRQRRTVSEARASGHQTTAKVSSSSPILARSIRAGSYRLRREHSPPVACRHLPQLAAVSPPA
jgi:MoaA/NifB/PqqE/SkfB family radical SAM enzyme